MGRIQEQMHALMESDDRSPKLAGATEDDLLNVPDSLLFLLDAHFFDSSAKRYRDTFASKLQDVLDVAADWSAEAGLDPDDDPKADAFYRAFKVFEAAAKKLNAQTLIMQKHIKDLQAKAKADKA